MKLPEFQSVVAQNAPWFEGVHPETLETLTAAERKIGAVLPPSLKWLLSERGYSSACGIDSLDIAVEVTLRCRKSLQLPERYILLNDWGDAGVVFLDTATANAEGEYKVFLADTHYITRLANGQEVSGDREDVDVFSDFPEWIMSRLEDEIQEANESTGST